MNRRKLFRNALALAGLGVSAPLRAGGTSAKAAGFHIPLESMPHTRTFMQWPASQDIYGDQKALNDVRNRIAAIANAVQKHEPVVMLAKPEQMAAARPLLEKHIDLWPIDTQDLWCRDSGPSFVVDGKSGLAVTDLNFNGWGSKQEHDDDARIALRVANTMGLRTFNNGLIGEGGGFETDGAGTLLAHESSWVNTNRNSGTLDEVTNLLLQATGADKIIWAPGVAGTDITDFHIDSLARFVKPGQVVMQLPDAPDSEDPWSVAAFETYNILKSATDAGGRKLDIVVIPDPVNIRSTNENFVSSYVNYYVCNGAVICGEFGDDKADSQAADILKKLYPGREVISLDIDPIGESGGGIHCATQQEPAA